MINVGKVLWPESPVESLAAKGKVSTRAAEYWLAGQRDISLEAARELICSEDGWPFLVAFMGDCDARWWQRVKLRYDSGKLKREIATQQKRLAELVNKSQQADMKLD